MSLSAALYAYLKTRGALVNLIGGADAIRLYDMVAPKDAVARPDPYVTFQRVTKQTDHHLKGAGGLAWAAMQFDVWGDDMEEVEAVADALRGALDGLYHWQQPDDGVHIRSALGENETDDYEAPDDDSEDGGTFRTRMEYRVSYRESVPAP